MSTAQHYSPLLDLPLEIREQILFEALSCSSSSPKSNPSILPFDRPVLQIFTDNLTTNPSKSTTPNTHNFKALPQKTTTVPTLLTTNRQIHAEASAIIWSKFAIHITGHNSYPDHSSWLSYWHCRQPTVPPTVRHLQIRWTEVVEWDVDSRQDNRKIVDKKKLHSTVAQVRNFPGLLSVRVQVHFLGTLKTPSNAAKRASVRRLAALVYAIRGLNVRVDVFLEPNGEAPWGREVVRLCQDEVRQRVRTTGLLEEAVVESSKRETKGEGLVWSFLGHLSTAQDEEWKRDMMGLWDSNSDEERHRTDTRRVTETKQSITPKLILI
ncbi:hypothetical protein BU24DRAFT_72723 [Aaosphaeria arxii CBS 175.79]|uniref:F-box domain-containing protein n=1 Tax=Aaosphaeria arxii CBS 175.79 TaxID=1450172 RepID=A0A6A5XBE3_9PLEO|nr:uncharacterized protein BU24DRAFT_72723 [Aaosphaeria arxii CBS 175.79]KAF2010166.1 hypothetical protein BU24DRAFT_72723 [Aaosphaeria arxii CBS 175.79]